MRRGVSFGIASESSSADLNRNTPKNHLFSLVTFWDWQTERLLLKAGSSPTLTRMPQAETIPNKKAAQRRSQRLLLRIQVIAERPAEQGQGKNEDTETLAVNAHGALILLSPPVNDSEQISLKNKKTGESQPCRVVYLGQTESGRIQVGVEFMNPSPQFWRIVFPPEDWTANSKEVRAPTKI